MENSILKSIKKRLGLADDYDVFDQDVIDGINSALSTLNQLGVGPVNGFMIEDDTPTWEALLGDDPKLNNVKEFIYLTVKRSFDPPATGFHSTALQQQLDELTWRINVSVEPGPDYITTIILDGGTV